MINIRIISSLNELDNIQKKWQELFSNGNHEPSTSIEWTNALIKNHTKLYSDLFFLIVERDSNMIGIIPIITKKEKIIGQTIVTISPISELYNTHSDLLVNLSPKVFLTELLLSLRKIPCNWDLFRMTRFLEGQPLLSAFESALTKTGMKYRARYEQPSFYLTLSRDFDQYLNDRSSKFRNYLKRMQKKLSIQGETQFIKIENENNFEKVYKNILHIEAQSWKHHHGTSISAIKRQAGFYKQMCHEALKNRRLLLTFLFLNGTPIAYDMGYIHQRQYYYLKTSFDENYRKASPATVLRSYLIQYLIEKKMEIFDFPGEPYAWETQWTDDMRWHKSLLVFNKTIKANIYRAIVTVKDTLNKPNNGKALDFQDPRGLRAPGD